MVQLNCTSHTGPLGWVDPPNQRGTIGIIWSCLLIIFASTWTVLHVNLPAENEPRWHISVRKIRWALFTVFAPEVIIAVSSCQCASARASVEPMKQLGASHWTLVHGFFADSGGFVLHAPDVPPFPVNTRAIYYLASHKYIDIPTVTERLIWDRSKADNFAKIVACIQSLYMVAQCIARADQSLEISCLELLTVAFVFCAAVSYYFWMSKPFSAESPISINLRTDMATVLRESGSTRPYHSDTPMDFVEQPGWNAYNRRPSFKNFGGLTRRPLDRIPNDYWPQFPNLRSAIPIWLVSITFGAIHLLAWNFQFPTSAELWAWRIASLTALVLLFFLGLVQVLDVYPGINQPLTFLVIWTKTYPAENSSLLRRWLVNTPETLGYTLYFIARLVIVTESFVSLRLMSSSAYQAVKWSNYWPHL